MNSSFIWYFLIGLFSVYVIFHTHESVDYSPFIAFLTCEDKIWGIQRIKYMFNFSVFIIYILWPSATPYNIHLTCKYFTFICPIIIREHYFGKLFQLICVVSYVLYESCVQTLFGYLGKLPRVNFILLSNNGNNFLVNYYISWVEHHFTILR